jgi:propionyl-CoA synthetase
MAPKARLSEIASQRAVSGRFENECFIGWGTNTLSRCANYHELYQEAVDDADAYWLRASEDAFWRRKPSIARNWSADDASWFPDGSTNACEAALDLHVSNGRADAIALIFFSAYSGTREQLTFGELTDRVARFAGGLCQNGVAQGDRVLIYMPTIPDAIVAMLACARLGAVHSVVFGGFGAVELAARIDDCAPKAIVAATCGNEPGRVVPYTPLLLRALSTANHKPSVIVMKQRSAQALEDDYGFIDFDALIQQSEPVAPVEVNSGHPLYILYTSGTTGDPKGLIRDTGGYLTALAWSMRHIYGASEGDVFWAASDVGWVVGHSYIVYGPLAAGCTTVLFEGKPVGTPDAGAFWKIVEDARVNILFTAPTAIRAIKRDDPSGEFIAQADLTSLRALFLAGERADPGTLLWAVDQLGKPVVDHWWQTELGTPALSGFPGIGDTDYRVGSAGRAVPGFRFDVVDDSGHSVAFDCEGALVIDAPLPPGCATAIWNDPGDRYRRLYLEAFPGRYATGDFAMVDDHGFITVLGRTDDVINVAGHRLSTGAIEEVISSDHDVAECAVIGVADALKGQMPLAFVVLKLGAVVDERDIRDRLANAVRDKIGPIASLRRAYVVPGLPKTRSGKILRRIMRDMAEGRRWITPSTIDDPSVLDLVAQVLAQEALS